MKTVINAVNWINIFLWLIINCQEINISLKLRSVTSSKDKEKLSWLSSSHTLLAYFRRFKGTIRSITSQFGSYQYYSNQQYLNNMYEHEKSGPQNCYTRRSYDMGRRSQGSVDASVTCSLIWFLVAIAQNIQQLGCITLSLLLHVII